MGGNPRGHNYTTLPEEQRSNRSLRNSVGMRHVQQERKNSLLIGDNNNNIGINIFLIDVEKLIILLSMPFQSTIHFLSLILRFTIRLFSIVSQSTTRLLSGTLQSAILHFSNRTLKEQHLRCMQFPES